LIVLEFPDAIANRRFAWLSARDVTDEISARIDLAPIASAAIEWIL
jgi:hypothetical protein